MTNPRSRIERLSILLIVLCLAVAAFAVCARIRPVSKIVSNPAIVTIGAPVANGPLVSTGQVVRPAGQTCTFDGRAIDLALSPDGSTVFIKNNDGLTVIDAKTWTLRQQLKYNDNGSSMHGIAVSRDGSRVFLSAAGRTVEEARIGADGKAAWSSAIVLPDKSYPCGIALSADGKHAYVALSRKNSLGIVDLETGTLMDEIPTGVAPYGVVLSPDGDTAYVSNWGGRKPKSGEHHAKSSGTDVAVDERGIGISGTVSKLDLKENKVLAELEVGLHPAGLALCTDGSKLYSANASSDTVTIIDTQTFRSLETLLVRPDEKLPFGSITNAVALSEDGHTLYAANGGNNAIALISLAQTPGEKSQVRGFIPSAWFPGAVAARGSNLFVACVKGDGLPYKLAKDAAWKVTRHRGSACKVALPDDATLAGLTARALADAKVQDSLTAREQAHAGTRAVPVPERPGEPSVFQHVVYVLKENRTYDQVFGDMPQGNSDPKLCIYGREITPNHHALAEQFGLLDNYYCNGVVSADGHQWATQGIVTDSQEKAFGGWTRSYDFGTDALVYAPTAFIWDNALLHGLSFRNYGEFDFPALKPRSSWFEVYADYKSGARKIVLNQSIDIECLRPYTCPSYPGWNLDIPDALRMDAFMKEFEGYQKRGDWPNLVLVYLPQDHTSGTSESGPTPRAHLADNDLALGRLVEAISKSSFWPTTCIFVNEDDPQDGFDHVDGHRSLCLAISPYSKRQQVIKHFYNQTSVLHTIERMLGLPAMNQNDGLAPVMNECFTDKADLTPFTALKNNIELDEKHAKKVSAAPPGENRIMDFSRPDRIDDDEFNRMLWHDAKGEDAPYPAQLAGAHGKGLKALRLALDGDDD